MLLTIFMLVLHTACSDGEEDPAGARADGSTSSALVEQAPESADNDGDVPPTTADERSEGAPGDGASVLTGSWSQTLGSDIPVMLMLQPDGYFELRGACNDVGGTWKLDGSTLRFVGEFRHTLAGCSQTERARVDAKVLELVDCSHELALAERPVTSLELTCHGETVAFDRR